LLGRKTNNASNGIEGETGAKPERLLDSGRSGSVAIYIDFRV